MTPLAVDLILIGVGVVWGVPLVAVAFIFWRVARAAQASPIEDEQDEIERRRRARAQERAVASRLRGVRGVVCELQPRRKTPRE